MYWFLRPPEEDPFLIVQELKRLEREHPGGVDAIPDEERVKTAKQLIAWGQEAGKHYYHPNEKERRYLLQPHFLRGISGGNRSGKTATNVIDMIAACEGWHPLQKDNLKLLAEKAVDPWVREHCKTLLENRQWIKDPPLRCRVISVDFPNYVEKVIGPEFDRWQSASEMKMVAYDNDKKRKNVWKNGSVVEFMTYEQPVKAHGGAARDLIYMDEEPLEDIYQESLMRVISTDGRITVGMTAVNGVTWTEDDLWAKGDEGDKDVFTIEMSTYDNPINTPEIIDKIKARCRDETELSIRIYGKRMARGGSVYKMCRDEEPWIIDPIDVPKDKGMLVVSIDPHPNTPHAVMWVWVDFDGEYHDLIDGKPNLYEVAELFEPGHIPHLASIIRMMELKIGRQHDVSLCDPAGWLTTQANENARSIVDQLNEAGIFPVKGSKDLSGGILKVGELLTVEDGQEHPRLMTSREMLRTRWERKNYRWPTPKMNQKDPRQQAPKPVDRDDHLMECERRIVEFVVDGNLEVHNPAPETNMFARPTLLFNGKAADVDWGDDDDDGEYRTISIG